MFVFVSVIVIVTKTFGSEAMQNRGDWVLAEVRSYLPARSAS